MSLCVIAFINFLIYTNFSKIPNNSLENLSVIEDYSQRFSRKKYDIDCRKILQLEKSEISRAKALLKNLTDEHGLALLPDSNFIFNKSMCSIFRSSREYDRFNVSLEEIDFPLAFSMLVYNDIEQFERLLRAVYRKQNIYCIHVDKKSSRGIQQAVKSIVDCFDNVFVATKLENVVYASVNRLLADINCMKDLMRTDRNDQNLIGKRVVKWKYLINMASSEFPLRTNYELTQILRIFNGSNVIEINKQMNWVRVEHSYTFHNNSKYPYQNGKTKTRAPFNFTIQKSSAYNAFHRDFIEYALNSKNAIELLKWANDTYSPDEWFEFSYILASIELKYLTINSLFDRYWATLQYNTQFYSKSGFIDRPGNIDCLTRFAGWDGDYDCKGIDRNGLCVFSIGDLPILISSPKFVINKFLLSFDPLSYQCIEEWYEHQVETKPIIDMNYYCKFIKTHSKISECI
jgi:hypothetical protein